MKIFYSWQSDIDKKINCNFIQKALNAAVSKIESENPGVVIPVDRDTKDTSGAVNIVQTILNKIKESQILVYDISIINSKDNSKKCINPNVAYELGFGVSCVGWENVILVFNKEYGDIDNDIPFDIRGHRILTYTFNGDSHKSKMAFNELTNSLKDALESIMFNKKHKNVEENSPQDFMLENDKKLIFDIFSRIYIPEIDRFCSKVEESLSFYTDIFYYYEGIKALINSSMYYVYDQELKKKVEEFYSAFDKCLSFGKYANTSGNICRIRPNDDNIEMEILKAHYILKTKLVEFIGYCKASYPILNINEITKNALREYKDFMEK